MTPSNGWLSESLDTEKPRNCNCNGAFPVFGTDRPFQWPKAPTQGEREDVTK